MKAAYLSVIGFLLFAIGLVALILSLVGLKLSFLAFVDKSPLLGLIIKLLLIMFGIILLYVSRTETE